MIRDLAPVRIFLLRRSLYCQEGMDTGMGGEPRDMTLVAHVMCTGGYLEKQRFNVRLGCKGIFATGIRGYFRKEARTITGTGRHGKPGVIVRLRRSKSRFYLSGIFWDALVGLESRWDPGRG